MMFGWRQMRSDHLHLKYIDADKDWQRHIEANWGKQAACHMHIEDGFSILAVIDEAPVGLISVYWRPLPPPLIGAQEGYIDIIEVRSEYRRQSIAARMIAISADRARDLGAYQLRAWSSNDKTEAIPMWKALGFGLYPAIIYPGGQKVEGYYVTKVLEP